MKISKFIIFIIYILVEGTNNAHSNEMIEKTFTQAKSMMKWALSIKENTQIDMDVTFYLYTKHFPEDPKKLLIENKETFINSDFNPKLKTAFVIHGWTDHKDRDIIVNLRRALLANLDVNVIIVDWKQLAGQLYFHAAPSTNIVGERLSIFISTLIDNTKTNLDNIHLIGHSLGGQISGIAGALLNGKLGRITGLDPAGPMFEFIYVEKPRSWLDKSDAKFVDVIHTAADDFGVSEAIGHADFYPNDGISPQPGCLNPLTAISCSHVRAVEYFIESLNTTNGFTAVPCSSWINRALKNCQNGEKVNMGYFLSEKTRGTYYFQTASKSPYALGLQGI